VGIAARLVQRRARRLGQVARLLSRFAFGRPEARDPRSTLEARSTLDRIDDALGRMSAAKRVVVLMAEVHEMTCAEIASALEIPIGTVWTRLHAARRELRAAVPEWGEP
jgi:RNA polymerase sigma-70 factor (ECF subfamily)